MVFGSGSMRGSLPKSAASNNQCNFLCRNALAIKTPHNNLVLTEKTGLFSAVLAAKTMFCEIKIEFTFVFWQFLKIFRVASRCNTVFSMDSDPLKKIIP